MDAKVSQQIAHYREGHPNKECALCTMFRAPHSCTAVAGRIEPSGVCKYFDRKKGV